MKCSKKIIGMLTLSLLMPAVAQAQFGKVVATGSKALVEKLAAEGIENGTQALKTTIKNGKCTVPYSNDPDLLPTKGFPTNKDFLRKLNHKADNLRRDLLKNVVDEEVKRQADLPLTQRNVLKYSNADLVRFDIYNQQTQSAISMLARKDMQLVSPKEAINTTGRIFKALNQEYIPADKVTSFLQDGTLIPYVAQEAEHGFIEHAFVIQQTTSQDIIGLPNGMLLTIPKYMLVKIPLNTPNFEGRFAREMAKFAAHTRTMLYADKMHGFIYKNGAIVGEKNADQVYRELKAYFEDALVSEKYLFVNKRTPVLLRVDELLYETPAPTTWVDSKNVYVLTKDVTVANAMPEFGASAGITTYSVQLPAGSRVIRSEDGYVWRVLSPEEFARFYTSAPAPKPAEIPAD